ncbi:MAG TPA: hypothetical protein VGF18_08495 [Candidatus Tumulicola sp.]
MFVGILTLAVAGCSSGNASLPSTAAAAPASDRASRHQHSWMLGEASSENLLYISDSVIGGLIVYSYTPPRYKLVGVLTPPSSPTYVCVDNEQNVYATNPYSVIEYQHGATSPLRILGGIDYDNDGCAVNPLTDTLAVSTFNGYPHPGEVAFFNKSRARHTTIVLQPPYNYPGACAYDGSGNFFVAADVPGTSPRFALLELPKGTKKFVEVTPSKQLDGVGGMAWDGKYLDIADYSKDAIYQFSIAGQNLTLQGTIALDRSYRIGGFFIDGSTLIAPANSKPPTSDPDNPRLINLYNYPAGGAKTGEIRGVSSPASVVVSLAKTEKRKR